MGGRAGYRFDSRRPTLRSFPGDRVIRGLEHRVGVKPTPLAPAPTGLRPVLGERGLPLVGKIMEMLRDPEAVPIGLYHRYGPVFWVGGFGTKMVMVVTPEGAQQVLANKGKVFSQTGWEYFIGQFFSRGLMLLDGEEHHLHRRIMQEAFTRPRLEGYLAPINELVDATVPSWPIDEPMLLFPAVKNLSLDVAIHVFMGAEAGPDADRLTEAFVDTVRAGAGLVRRRVPGLPFLSWNRGLAGRKVLDDYFRSRITAKRASTDSDLFAVLTHVETEEGERFSDDDVVNHMIFLLMAAHDTSTITASASAYFLAKNPEWQERCYQESLALGDGPVDLGALEKLESLDLVSVSYKQLTLPKKA
jgi:cytochrome P450